MRSRLLTLSLVANMGLALIGVSSLAQAHTSGETLQYSQVQLPFHKWPAKQQIAYNLKKWGEMWGNKPFSFSGYESLFSQSDLLVFDNFLKPNTRLDGFAAYRTFWEKEVNENMPGWRVNFSEIHSIEVREDLGYSTLTFAGKGITADGTEYFGSQHCTHIWKKRQSRWVIIHENCMGPVLVEGEPLKVP